MGQLVNGIEVIQPSKENTDYVVLAAVVTDTWYQSDFLYWDTSANKVKKYAPADSTAHTTNQNAIIGIAGTGKVAGEDRAIVHMKATVLGDATSMILGADCVVVYTAATGKYSFWEEAGYNAMREPNITLASSFAVCADESAEADGRGKIRLDGVARLAALT